MASPGQGLKERNYASGPGAELQGESLTVKHAQVRPNAYNYNAQSPSMFNKLVASMREFGFTLPIIVREAGVSKRTGILYEIIDGEHRWRAAKELGMPEVRIVNLGEVSDEKAKQLTIILNELGGQPDQVRLAELLRDINKSVDFAKLAAVMPYGEKELNALIEAVDFSFASLSDEDTRPKIEATAAPEVPDEEQDASADEADVRSAMPGNGNTRNARLILALPPLDAAELEGKLARIDPDPVVAVQKAVEAWVSAQRPAPKGTKSPRVAISKLTEPDDDDA